MNKATSHLPTSWNSEDAVSDAKEESTQSDDDSSTSGESSKNTAHATDSEQPHPDEPVAIEMSALDDKEPEETKGSSGGDAVPDRLTSVEELKLPDVNDPELSSYQIDKELPDIASKVHFDRAKSTREFTLDETGKQELRDNRSLASIDRKQMEAFKNSVESSSVNLLDCWTATREFVRSLDRENTKSVQKLQKHLNNNGERRLEDVHRFLQIRDKFYDKFYKFEKSRNFLNAHFDLFDEREACSRELSELLLFAQTNIDSMLNIDRSRNRIQVSAKHRTGFNSLYSEIREKTLKLAQLDFQMLMEDDSQKILERKIMSDSTGAIRQKMSLQSLSERWSKLFAVPFRTGEFKEYLQKFYPEAFAPEVRSMHNQEDVQRLMTNLRETPNEEIIVNYDMINKYILFEHQLNASKVLGLLYDRQRTDNFFLVNCFWGCSRFACFIILWFLLMIYLFTNEGYLSGKVMQTMGARSQLLGTAFFEGKEYSDITNVKEMFFYMETVAFPQLYGFEEMNRSPDWAERGYPIDPYITGMAMNPYLLGGVRMRVVRFEKRDCEKAPPEGQTNPFTRCVSSLETNIEKSPWTNFTNAPYINVTLLHRSQQQIDEQDVIRGITKYGYAPGGYVWDFPSLFAEDYFDSSTNMPKFPKDASELARCTCEPATTNDPVGDTYDTDCFVSIDQPLALCDALLQLQSFRKFGVVDEQTRGIFFDFNLYGPSSQLHTLGRLFFEFKYGLIYPNYQFDSYQLTISDNQRYIYYAFSVVLSLFILIHVFEIFLYCHILGCPGCVNDFVELINQFLNLTCCRTPFCPPQRRKCCRITWGKHCCRMCYASSCRDIGKVSKDLAEYEVNIGLQRVVGRYLNCQFVCCGRLCCGNVERESHLESIHFMRIMIEHDPHNASGSQSESIELMTRTKSHRNEEDDKHFEIASEIIDRARQRKEDDPDRFLPLIEDSDPQCKQDAEQLKEWDNLPYLRNHPRVRDLLDLRMPGWRGEKRLYLRIPFFNTTGNRVYLRLGHLQRVIERASHQFFNRDFSIRKGERFVRPDRIKKNAYGGVDSFWIINVPKEKRNMIIDFDSFENQADDTGALCPECCGCGDRIGAVPLSKQTIFDHSTTRGPGDGMALPQHASDAERKFCKLIYKEIMQSLDTDEYLSEARITMYRGVSFKDVSQSCLRYTCGMGMKIMYRQAVYVIDAMLIFLFSFYLYMFYDALNTYDESILLSTETFHSLRYRKEREDYSRFLLFCLFLFSCLRLTYALVRLNKEAELYWQVLCYSLTQLIGFAMLLGFIMVAFAFSGWALFGGQMIEFGDPFQSVQTMIRSLVNDLPISEMQDASMWGSLYYILWFFFIPFMFLNIIVAILLTAWEKIRKEQETSQNTSHKWQEFSNHWRACTKIVICCRCCQRNISESSETRIQGGQFTGNPKEWQAVYPAGCPPEKLTTYLRKYWGVNRSVDNIIDIIDSDGGGMIGWGEIREKLINLHPNLASGIFSLHDETHRRMNRMDMKLESVRDEIVHQDSWESEMINTFGLKKAHVDKFRAVGYDDMDIWDEISRKDLVALNFDEISIKKWQRGVGKKLLKDMGLGSKFALKFKKEEGLQDVSRWRLISDDKLKRLGFKDGHIKKWRRKFTRLNPSGTVEIFQDRVPLF